MDFFVESTAHAGSDTLVIHGTTHLYVPKDGNNLAIGTGVNDDWAIIHNYYRVFWRTAISGQAPATTR